MILELFPTAVMVENIGRTYTDKEFAIFVEIQQTLKANDYGNSVSQSKTLLDDYEGLADIKLFLNDCIKKYVDEVMCPAKPLELEITQSFSQFTNKGESYVDHTHPNSILSGVIYIQTNPETDKIIFNKNQLNKQINIFASSYNKFNSATWWVPSKAGEVLIFPSSLIHGVGKVAYDGTRISLSFNTWVKGEKGLSGYDY
jgi:uncharacterized protein (TIGR02466 family)